MATPSGRRVARVASRLLKFYALRHLREELSPTEEVDKARMTQVTFEGITLELTTVDLGVAQLSGRLERQVWSTSVLFPVKCRSPDEVEDQLIQMFSGEPAESPEAATPAPPKTWPW